MHLNELQSERCPVAPACPGVCQVRAAGGMLHGEEQANPDVFDLQRAMKEFRGYKRVAAAGGGAGHGWLLICAQVSSCCGGGSGCLQEYQDSFTWLGWKAVGLVSIPKFLKLHGPE